MVAGGVPDSICGSMPHISAGESALGVPGAVTLRVADSGIFPHSVSGRPRPHRSYSTAHIFGATYSIALPRDEATKEAHRLLVFLFSFQLALFLRGMLSLFLLLPLTLVSLSLIAHILLLLSGKLCALRVSFVNRIFEDIRLKLPDKRLLAALADGSQHASLVGSA